MNPRKMIFASDSFKGSLSQEQILSILKECAKKQFPDCKCVCLTIADGGEGTARAVTEVAGGKMRTVKVHDPLMRSHKAAYGILPGGRAIIEMAEASGLPLVPEDRRDPRNTSSYGTGELIMDAIKQGCRDIRIALGGSATNDGGMGAFRAMGFRFLDENGEELEGYGRDLAKVRDIKTDQVPDAVKLASFTIMCDVNNPLCGPDGATYVFGLQKGGTKEILDELEAGMENYAEVVARKTGEHYEGFSGTGAAGGLGFTCAAFLRGHIRSGIETILDLVHFDDMLLDTNICITGEGRIDGQSMHGKAIHGVAKHCKKEGVPCIALVGDVADGYEKIYMQGITKIYRTRSANMSLKEAMTDAERLYRQKAEEMFRDIANGNLYGG